MRTGQERLEDDFFLDFVDLGAVLADFFAKR